MAENKKSFLLYVDLIHTVNKLPDEKAGELFKHILGYVNDLNPETDDIIIQISFEPIKQQLKRDLKKYESICDRNKLNGQKGGRPKKPKKPTGLSGNPKKPKKPDNDIDSDTDNDIFKTFWDSYHLITKKQKTDKIPASKKWKKLSNQEKKKAIDNIKLYFDSLNDKRYCKKARTYLDDKSFNDQFKSTGFTEQQKNAFV